MQFDILITIFHTIISLILAETTSTILISIVAFAVALFLVYFILQHVAERVGAFALRFTTGVLRIFGYKGPEL